MSKTKDEFIRLQELAAANWPNATEETYFQRLGREAQEQADEISKEENDRYEDELLKEDARRLHESGQGEEEDFSGPEYDGPEDDFSLEIQDY